MKNKFGFNFSLFVSTLQLRMRQIFNARHYKADADLYGKFTAKTGIKVNLINGKSGALGKEEAIHLQTFTLLLMLEDVELWMLKEHFKVDYHLQH